MNELKTVRMIRDFPIGGQASTREGLLCKAEIISYLSKFQSQFSAIENIDDRELLVKQYLGDMLCLEDGEVIPDLLTAERLLKMSPGFLQDFGKIQFIQEKKPSFNETFNIIADSMELNNNHYKMR